MNTEQHPGLKFLAELPFETPDRLVAGREFKLDVPRDILEELGNPQNKIKSIHIAGTNGKGSVCSYLGAMLRAAGYHVGQFTSPHLSSVTERCAIDGVPVSDSDFGNAVLTIKEIADRRGLNVSFFEYTTLVSFLIFAQKKLDWIVVEVGLGGRLDATNLIEKPEVSVITSVGLDHTHILGDTITKIALEKAGIIKPGAPVFCGELEDSARAAIRRVAVGKDVPIEFMGVDFELRKDHNDLQWETGRFGFPVNFFATRADYQLHNAALSVRVAEELRLEKPAIEKGLLGARWPGRAEKIWVGERSDQESDQRSEKRCVLFDVAHNLDGIAELKKFLRTRCSEFRKVRFLVSIVGGKDWQSILHSLAEMSNSVAVEFVFTKSSNARSLEPEEFVKHLGKGEVIMDPEKALNRCLNDSSEDQLLVVTGSVFLVGQLRALLVDEPFRTMSFD